MPPPLLVFDLDGTLIDSRRDLADSTNELLAAHGAPPLPLEAVAGFVGDGARVLVERALAASGLALDLDRALADFLAIYDRRLLVHTRPYPGIVTALERVAVRAAMAVLTNKPGRPTRALLDAFHLTRLFQWIVGGDGDAPRKPDPASLLRMMHEAGVTRDATLMIGDSMVDVETARRAGARILVARYGFGLARGLDLTGDEIVVDAPEDLGRVLDEFVARATSSSPSGSPTPAP